MVEECDCGKCAECDAYDDLILGFFNLIERNKSLNARKASFFLAAIVSEFAMEHAPNPEEGKLLLEDAFAVGAKRNFNARMETPND